jgi:hypothetical protein
MRPALLTLAAAVALAPSWPTARAEADQSQKEPAPEPRPIPTDAECLALGAPRGPLFPVGETLDFELDAMGASAGKLTFQVLPRKNGELPVQVKGNTNTFFSKMRRVTATATSYLDPQTLRPRRYVERSVENEIPFGADVRFRPKERKAHLDYSIREAKRKRELRYGNDGLDPVGAIFLLRQIPLKEGMPICFDSYGMRTVWRVHGKVAKREQVSMKLGEFQAWHIEGEAVRVDNPRWRREIHVWISDDDQRLPLAAVGVMDLGTVRATLTGWSRPGQAPKKAQGAESIKF